MWDTIVYAGVLPDQHMKALDIHLLFMCWEGSLFWIPEKKV